MRLIDIEAGACGLYKGLHSRRNASTLGTFEICGINLLSRNSRRSESESQRRRAAWKLTKINRTAAQTTAESEIMDQPQFLETQVESLRIDRKKDSC